jgi:hypothetical protein
MRSVDRTSVIRGKKFLRVAVAVTAGVAALWTVAASPRMAIAAPPPPATKLNDQFSDWFENMTPGYVGSPFLTDANRGAINAIFQAAPSDRPLAVKITKPINNTTANLIFNNSQYHVSYVFGDLESPNSPQLLSKLNDQIRYANQNGNGQKSSSFNAFVGNFGFQKLEDDFTNPKQYQKKKNKHSFAGWDLDDYKEGKLNMSMPALYPGSPSYRNPAQGDSKAPNIRSALFILPPERVSQIKVNTDSKETIVPWVARFNNWDNPALDTDRNPSNGFRFVPGQPMAAAFGFPSQTAAQTTDQMLSRRDFATQVAHYRLRGADSFVLFEPGVEGYLQDTKRADAKKGFTEPHIDSIFQASDFKLLLGKDTDYPPASSGNSDPNENTIVDGNLVDNDKSGAMFSGVYSLSLKRMDVLMSNMDDDEHTLTLPPKIGGFTLQTKSFDLDGGTHLLVEYKLTTSGVNKGWSVMTKTFPFLELPNNRNEVGIPEPANMTLLAMLAFLGVTPRRRRKELSKVA